MLFPLVLSRRRWHSRDHRHQVSRRHLSSSQKTAIYPTHIKCHISAICATDDRVKQTRMAGPFIVTNPLSVHLLLVSVNCDCVNIWGALRAVEATSTKSRTDDSPLKDCGYQSQGQSMDSLWGTCDFLCLLHTFLNFLMTFSPSIIAFCWFCPILPCKLFVSCCASYQTVLV